MARRSRIAPGTLIALATFVAAGASAQPLAYDEAVDGPLPTQFNPVFPAGPQLPEFLTLGIGVNLVSGTATWGTVSTFDTVPMILPADGSRIDSITLTVSNIQVSGTGTLTQVGMRLYTYDAGATEIVSSVPANPSGTTIAVPLSNLPLFLQALPQPTAGNYGIGFNAYVGSLGIGSSVDFDYTWTITVSETQTVPALPNAASTALTIALVAIAAASLRGRGTS